MPDVRPNVTYTVTLSAAEFRLIGLALAGKIKPDTKEDREAVELNRLMLRVRAAYLADLYKVATGAVLTADPPAAREGPDGPTPLPAETTDG